MATGKKARGKEESLFFIFILIVRSYSVVCIGLGLYSIYIAQETGSLILWGNAVGLLLAGGGLWYGKKWARALGAVLGLVWIGYLLYQITASGITLGRVLGIVALFLGTRPLVRNLLRKKEKKSKEKLISIVLLLKEPRKLEMEEAKELIFRAWGIRLREDTEGKEWITRMGPTYGIASRFGYYGIHVADQCYVEDPEAVAEKIVDMRLQHILRTHQAWVAVDLMEVGEEIPSEEKAYTYIGQLLAELVDENCLGVYCPQTQRMNAYTPELVEKLRGPNPLEDLKEPAALPVLQVEEDDPRMKAAVEEAKSRWPEFVEAFQKRQSGENFAIKAPIRSGENCEFIWIEVTAMEGERIHGKILNEPLDLPGYAMNSAVTVELKDLNDWMVWDGEEMKGGFTAKVLGEVMKERRGEAPSAAASR